MPSLDLAFVPSLDPVLLNLRWKTEPSLKECLEVPRVMAPPERFD